jgi:hypothetical protein
VAVILKAIVDKGISPENVGALEKIVGLYERMEEKNAERTFSAALVKLQSDVSNIKAVRPVTINGTVRYRFAPYEDLMIEVGPHLAANSFTVSYSTKIDGDRLTKTLHLRHACGHVEDNDYSTKISRPIANREGNAVVSEAQMESMASTTAKRGALSDCLNLIIEKYEQDDVRNEGAEITAEQAVSLEKRVTATLSDKSKFLKFAAAPSFDKIMSSRYQELDQFLAKRERVQAQQQAQYIFPAKAEELRKRVAECGADEADFLAGIASFETIPISKLAFMEAALKKLEGKA